jgi:hypothetical protein
MVTEYLPYEDADFEFLSKVSPEMIDTVFDILDIAVMGMWEAMESDPEEFLKKLDPKQATSMQAYFKKLLDLYTQYEFYEESVEIVLILDQLEKKIVN